MENNDPKSQEDVKDPIGKIGWPKEKGRDGERTPMQWNDSTNAGFSQTAPWLPIPPSYKTRNVAGELKDPDSVLQFYRHALALRHQNAALRDGQYVPLNENDQNVLSYLRRYKDEAVLVVLNMSGSEQKVSFDLSPQGLGSARPATLITTMSSRPQDVQLSQITLEPFGVYIAKIAK